jgi:hypothetical protein
MRFIQENIGFFENFLSGDNSTEAHKNSDGGAGFKVGNAIANEETPGLGNA